MTNGGKKQSELLSFFFYLVGGTSRMIWRCTEDAEEQHSWEGRVGFCVNLSLILVFAVLFIFLLIFCSERKKKAPAQPLYVIVKRASIFAYGGYIPSPPDLSIFHIVSPFLFLYKSH